MSDGKQMGGKMHWNKKVLLTAVYGRGSMVFENAAALADALGASRQSVYARLNGHRAKGGLVSGKVNYMGRMWYVDYLFEPADVGRGEDASDGNDGGLD